MALQLYLGCSGSGKSYELYKHIIDESISHPELTYLILVPEQYNLTTQQQLISMHPRKGILNIDVLSFSRLAHRVFEEVGYVRAKGVVIDDTGKNLILRHMAGNNEDKLTALSGMFSKPGYISEVKSVISEFMQYGIGDRELDELIKKSSDRGILRDKLKDLKLLYNEFQRYINEKYITTEEILMKVRDAVPASLKLKDSVIVLDGYTGFTPVQTDLIEALLINCRDVYLAMLTDPRIEQDKGELSEQDVFYMSYRTVAALDKLCKKNDIERKADIIINEAVPARFLYDEDGTVIKEQERSHELIHLEKNLFRRSGKRFPSGGENIHIFCGTDPYEEAVEAAVRIEKLVRDEGYHYRDIAVVSGDTGTYMNACARAFIRYDIPFFADRTLPVMLNPMIEYIRSVFDVINDNYSAETVFRYLRFCMDDHDRNAVDALENYVLRYGIRGRKQWSEKFIRKPDDMEAEELAELDALREKAVENIGLFMDDLDKTDNTDNTYTVADISTALYHYIERGGMAAGMKRLSLRFKEEGDPVRAKEYGSIYAQVCGLLDKMVSLLPGERVSLKEYAQLLDAGFEEIRTGVLPASDDHVQIGDIKRSRLRNIKALFLMGVNDGIIPAAVGNGGLISDMDREFLTEDDGIELAPTARMQAYTQRLYLYMLVTRPSKHLYISYAKLSGDGTSLMPSYFVKTVKQMFEGLVTCQPDESIRNRVFSERSGYDLLASSVQDAVRTEDDGKKKDYLTLFGMYTESEENRQKLEKVLQWAFSEGTFMRRDEISRAVAYALYGKELTCSISRLETYAKCAYSHFLKYGLSLKERELFSFEARDMGLIFHDTLQTYSGMLKERNLSWLDVNGESREKLIEEAIERTIGRGDYGAVYGSFRTKYMINRMRRITKKTVDVLTGQLEKGSFVPHDFEFAFSSSNDCKSLDLSLSEDEKIHLAGRIDRVDVCKKDGRVYVKVIDYKSGNKSFDLAAIYAGLDLQLAVYMNAAQEMISALYGKKAVPAGMFYYHIDDPLYDADACRTLPADMIDKKLQGQFKMKGLVNSDEHIFRLIDNDFSSRSQIIPVMVKKDGDFGPGSSVASTKEFEELSDRVNETMIRMGREILHGNIKIEPHIYRDSETNPCEYCAYADICGYRGEGVISEVHR